MTTVAAFLKPIFMDTIHGIPLRWDAVGDNALLGGLLSNTATQVGNIEDIATTSGSGSLFEDSPFGEGWDKPRIINDDDRSNTDYNTSYVIFVELKEAADVLAFYEDEEGKYNVFSKLRSSPDLFYIIYQISDGTKKLMLVRLGANIYQRLSGDSSLNPVIDSFSERIVSLGAAKDGFKYSKNDVIEALETEVENYRLNKQAQEGKSRTKANISDTYTQNYLLFKGKSASPNELATQNALKTLCRTIASVQPDVLETNNFAAKQNSNPRNYDLGFVYVSNKFTATDLLQLNKQILKLSREINKLQSCQFSSAKEIIDFATEYLMNGGSMIKYFNNYPFFNITKENRKCLLRKLLTQSSLNHIASVRDDTATAGEMVFQIFQGCPESELPLLIKELETEGILFPLLNRAGVGFWNTTLSVVRTIAGMGESNLFYQLSLGFGMWHMKSLQEEEKIRLQNQAIAKGNFIFFDDSFFGNRNAEKYEGDAQKISFEVKESALYSIPTLALCKNFIDKHFANSAHELLSSKKLLNPLDMVVMIPVVDMSFTWITMKKGGMYLMPACMAYIIFMEDTEKAIRIFASMVINIALCFIGVGALTAAIRTGSVLGIFAGVTDITLGVLAATVNSIPEIERNHPNFVKFVNYATIIYGLGRIGFELYKSVKITKLNKSQAEEVMLLTATDEERKLLLMSTIGGEPMDKALLDKITRSFRRQGKIIEIGTEEANSYLNWAKAEGVCFDENIIYLRSNPSTSAVYEEVIHSAQYRTGKYNKWVEKYDNVIAKNLMEREAAEKLLKNAKAWKIPANEIEIIKERLEIFNSELKKVGL
jgi:hypothetical protein